MLQTPTGPTPCVAAERAEMIFKALQLSENGVGLGPSELTTFTATIFIHGKRALGITLLTSLVEGSYSTVVSIQASKLRAAAW
jgi:hypothetical protein